MVPSGQCKNCRGGRSGFGTVVRNDSDMEALLQAFSSMQQKIMAELTRQQEEKEAQQNEK